MVLETDVEPAPEMSPQEQDREDRKNPEGRWFAGTVLLLWALGVIILFYKRGSGEHDTFMMAAGIARGRYTQEILNPFCYGQELQFLFYYLFHVVAEVASLKTAGILLAMNVMGAACALGIPFLLRQVFRRLLPASRQADLATLLFVTSPMYFYNVSYGHPFHLALVCCLFSLLLLFRALDQMSATRTWAFFGASLLLQSVAMMLRTEQVALFCCLALGFMFLRTGRPLRHWAAACVMVVGAVATFLVARMLFAHPVLSSSSPARASVLREVVLLLRTLDLRLVTWSGPHWITEIGPLLLLAALATASWCAWRREWRFLVAGGAGLLPSVVLYLGNPSPPRHLYIATLGCALLVAGRARCPRPRSVLSVAGAVLAFNLVFPWTGGLLAAKEGTDRPVVSYNVIERTLRNRAQIRHAFSFYSELVSKTRGPTVLFGNWVHVAQIFSLLADDTGLQYERVRFTETVSASHLRRGDLDLYLVELYDPTAVAGILDALRAQGFRFSHAVVMEGTSAEGDIGIPLPSEIRWWSS